MKTILPLLLLLLALPAAAKEIDALGYSAMSDPAWRQKHTGKLVRVHARADGSAVPNHLQEKVPILPGNAQLWFCGNRIYLPRSPANNEALKTVTKTEDHFNYEIDMVGRLVGKPNDPRITLDQGKIERVVRVDTSDHTSTVLFERRVEDPLSPDAILKLPPRLQRTAVEELQRAKGYENTESLAELCRRLMPEMAGMAREALVNRLAGFTDRTLSRYLEDDDEEIRKAAEKALARRNRKTKAISQEARSSESR